MRAYSLDLRDKVVESVKKGVSKSETARRFGVDRATGKRYCKLLGERGTLEPRYSPDLNPIEEAFSKVKHVLRKIAARTKEALVEAMGAALSAVNAEDARGFFAHCGYDTPAQQL